MSTTTENDSPATSTALSLYYDAVFSDPILREFCGDSGYANFGYWDGATRCAREAGDRLVDMLLEPIEPLRGTILDVACGQGASTRRLMNYFQPAAITGIGLSESQLVEARKRAPGCTFKRMDATKLDFDDETFDTVLCIEAAFHFSTRKRFLEETFRVLRPGGCLVLSDLLMAWGTPLVPAQNYVPNAGRYGDLLRDAGFGNPDLSDATTETWHAYRDRFNRFVQQDPSRWWNPFAMRDLLAANINLSWAIRKCLLVCARKPKHGMAIEH